MSYSIDTARKFVSDKKWIFAKTYAKTFPHEYIVKDNLDEKGREEFEKIVEFISNNGYQKKFFKRVYVYFEIDGFKYWTMGNPINETNILNREKINYEQTKVD